MRRRLPGRYVSQESSEWPKLKIINPATIYIAFSQRVCVRSKASERRFSHSKASSDNAAANTHALAYHNKFKELGATDKRQLGVAALAKGTTLTCELRLDLALVSSPECNINGCRVNKQ